MFYAFLLLLAVGIIVWGVHVYSYRNALIEVEFPPASHRLVMERELRYTPISHTQKIYLGIIGGIAGLGVVVAVVGFVVLQKVNVDGCPRYVQRMAHPWIVVKTATVLILGSMLLMVILFLTGEFDQPVVEDKR
ncbi:hypothetical protein BJ875DRAFT_477339 [Amylocarpus encephaloides]|uniref:Uncharacterized protein n=1 Tax=Amylocarpus encephaloides TaxID=45428 RepID=A0A9P7Y7C5_9HELO|nr:hypothetical protein BJ875DRAFT_477339 [Amylocarpus encephaloides]